MFSRNLSTLSGRTSEKYRWEPVRVKSSILAISGCGLIERVFHRGSVKETERSGAINENGTMLDIGRKMAESIFTLALRLVPRIVNSPLDS